MTLGNSLKLGFFAAALLGLAACTTTPKTATTPKAATMAKTDVVTSEKATEAENMKAVADELSATNNVSKSADGKLVCKRQAVVGSKFKRKICATAAQWAASEAESRRATGNIQRSAGPGTNN
jgi:uncharacterized lipoprotein YmbA